ncbi:MAG TPA: nucleotide-binding protein [Methanomicrobiales archaeon]|nr:nucleotide-binding protein [Methanomicrobiales archaeon]
MRAVLDASAFFSDWTPPEEKWYTTPSVVAELVDLQAKLRLEKLLAAGLQVMDPSSASLDRVREAALASGDAGTLSGTDRDLLALALDLGAALYTDDFAIQNAAHFIGVVTKPLKQRSARFIQWRFRCSGCGRYYPQEGTCPICGSIIKRKLK